MKQKIISALVLIGLLVTPMAAYADAAVGDQIVTIGTNLTQQQRQEVLSYFGAKDNAQIIDVDISEERQYLSGKVPDAQIGNSTNSCAMITYTTKGSGVNVTTHNINYVTPDAYKSAILTAGNNVMNDTQDPNATSGNNVMNGSSNAAAQDPNNPAGNNVMNDNTGYVDPNDTAGNNVMNG